MLDDGRVWSLVAISAVAVAGGLQSGSSDRVQRTSRRRRAAIGEAAVHPLRAALIERTQKLAKLRAQLLSSEPESKPKSKKGEGSRTKAERLRFLQPGVVQPPFAAMSPAHPNLLKYHPASSIHVFLGPATFLELTSSSVGLADRWDHTPRKTEAYTELMRRGEGQFPPLWLDVVTGKSDLPYIGSHEGRHRALAALRAGLSRVPVVLYLRPKGGWYEAPPRYDPVAKALEQGTPLQIRSQFFGRGVPELGTANPPGHDPVRSIRVVAGGFDVR
jgi:hypothetical protein